MPIDFLTLEILLPLLFVIAVVYGALETVGMFRNRAVKTLIAVVLAFFAVSNAYFVEMLYAFLPYALIFVIAFFAIGFAKKSFSGGERDNTMIIIIIGLVLLLLASFAKAGGGLPQYNEFLWFFGIIALVAILYAAYKIPDRQ
jgi:Na+-translocating ferredoxin:NAD+ oxidoreductase RnfD subunit